jgi:hypothetical protein
MEILKELRPSEVYFLMNWLAADEKLLNYTLGNLLMEKYLEVRFFKKLAHAKAKRMSTYKMIFKAANFENEDTRPYEKEILSIIGNSQKKEVQLRLFAKAVGANFWKGDKNFRDDYLGRCSQMRGYFQDNFLLKYFDRRTPKGKRLGKHLKQFFDKKEEELKSYQETNDNENILLLIASLGTHVILLKNFNNDIMVELRKHHKSRNNDYYDDFFFLDGGFLAFSDSFDSFDGFGGSDFGGDGGGESWGDGGSSDSGCSGCGGCGGCS